MDSVPLGSQNTVEFTASLPFLQHCLFLDSDTIKHALPPPVLY